MGLDCIFNVKNENGNYVLPSAVDWSKCYSDPERTPNLCGGMFSGNGSDGSFRGKVYAQFILSLTGYNLYDSLTEDQVKDTANKLESLWNELQAIPSIYSREAWINQYDGLSWFYWNGSIDYNILEDLKVVFRAYADMDAYLYGWS